MAVATPAHAACNVAGAYASVDGVMVKSPRCRGDESGARYLCRDGSYSFARHRRGACSRHGSVARELAH